MAFLTVGKEPPKKKQRLYILDIEMPNGMRLTKIGKASGNSSKERMLQINGSIFDKYRCTAKISIKRDREVDAEYVFKFENTLHKFFANYKYNSKTKWDGVTECFCVPIEDVVQAYELVIEGVEPDFVYQMPSTKETEDKLPF